MARPVLPWIARSFLPTWFAVAGILGIQMLSLFLLDESPNARTMSWSTDATAAVVIMIVTGVGAWAFPRVRAMTWLIGAMAVTLLTMRHSAVAFPEPVPPQHEVLAFYSAGAVLLAIGAWERARWAPSGSSPP